MATGYDQQSLLKQMLQTRIDELENIDDKLCGLHHEILFMTKQRFEDARHTDQLHDASRGIDGALVFLNSVLQQTNDWLREHRGESLESSTQGGDQNPVEEPSEQLESSSPPETQTVYLAGDRTDTIEELKKKSAAVEERLTRLEMQRSSGDIQNDLNEVEDLKNSLEEKKRLMTEKINRMHEKLSYLEMTKVLPLDERVIALESSSLQKEESSDSIGSRLIDLEKKHQCCDERVEVIETDKQKVEERFEKLESFRQKIEEKHESTDNYKKMMEFKLEIIDYEIQEAKTRLVDIDNNGQKTKESFGNFENEMQKMGEILKKIESDRQTIEDRFANIETASHKVEERFDKLENEGEKTKEIVGKIENDRSKAEEIIQDIKKQLQELDTGEIQLQDEMKGLKTTTEEIQKKEDQTKSMIEALVHPSSTMALPALNEEECKRSEEQCINRHLHAQFVDGQNFQVENLPEPYRDLELRDCVVRLAQLSCLIRVDTISENRPLVFPKTNKPYPFSGRGEEANIIRSGSGWVVYVVRHNSQCTCPICKKATSAPSQQHGVITVFTARHLVFDQSESEHTTAQLSLEGETFTLTDGVWGEVHGVQAHSCDWCQVDFVTHDMDLLNRLEAFVTNGKAAFWELNNKYDSDEVFGGLVVMASHPHGVGRAKVTIGYSKHWSGKVIDGKDHNQLCTTMTSCVGCSGAFVWPVGLRAPNGWWFILGIPHSERTHDGSQTTAWI